MDPTGNQVILGYADGVVRLFALESETDSSTKSAGSVYQLTKALSARYFFKKIKINIILNTKTIFHNVYVDV